MVRVTLRKKDAPSYKTAVIEFPALENKLAEKLGTIDIGIGTEKNCLVEKISEDSGGLQLLVGQLVSADEMQYLAKRMDSFDQRELQSFHAAAYADKLTSVKDLINLTFNLNCYTAVTDFSDIAAIGRTYELNRQGSMSMAELEQLDGAAVGRKLLDSGKGEVTPYGVLFRNGNVPEPVYNGAQFPQYSYRGDEVAMVTLEAGDYADGIQYEYLYLPCWDVEIAKALNRLGVANATDCATHLDSDQLSEEVQIFFTDDEPLMENLGTLNELTRCYRGFDRLGTDAFHAIVELAQPNTPEDVLVLAQNFYEFAAIPKIRTAEEYGKHIVFQCHDIDQNIESYIDFAHLGKDCIAMENGAFTPWGYIAYHGNTPAVLELLNGNPQAQTQGMKM